MTINSFDNLSRWFLDSKGAEAAPHWNLYGVDYGQAEKMISRYVQSNDMEASGRHLEQTIRALNNPDGTRFRLLVYPIGKHNNPTAQVYLQIYEKSAAPASNPAGIAGLPAGVGSIEQYVGERIKAEKLQWEIDALKEQINGPSNGFEKFMETLSVIPGIDGVLKAVAIGLIGKFNPSAMPAVQAAMNGIPGQPPGEHEADSDDDPNAAFLTNVQEAAASLGTDPATMVKRLNALVKAQPELAKQLLQQ